MMRWVGLIIPNQYEFFSTNKKKNPMQLSNINNLYSLNFQKEKKNIL